MSCENALTSQEIDDLTFDVRAESERLRGDAATVVTYSNGRTAPSPTKSIADAKLFKPSIPWTATTLITDASQAYSNAGKDYAPQQSLLPFTTGGTFTASNWYLIQGITDSQLEATIDAELTRDYATLALALSDVNAIAGARFSVDVHTTGSGSGVLFFKWVAGAAPSPDGGSQIDHDTLALYAEQNFPKVKRVKMWGAFGDGTTVDTVAIDNAYDFIKVTFAATLSGEIAGDLTDTLWMDPGDYNYTGTGLTIANGNINIAADPNSVRIRLPDGIYLLTATGAISNTNIVGINTYGGLGAVRYSFTGNNVTGKHSVSKCMFSDYTECAVGNDSEDMPHMYFEELIFRCREGEDAFGLALGGFADRVSLRKLDFRKNKVHMKIGDRLSGNITMSEIDFINTGAQDREADIWIVPNSTDAGGNASGQGTLFSNCKFGNESMAANDSRILVSTEAAGASRLNKQPSKVWDTASFVTGIMIEKNTFNGVGSQTAPLIKSYVQHCRGWSFKDNQMQGGDHTYLVEWAGDLDDDELSSLWDIDLAIGSNPHVRVMPISNQPMGIARDPFVQSGGDPATIQDYPTIADDVSFIELLPMQDPNSDGSLVGATLAAVDDGLGLGGQKAIELDASSATGRWVSAAITDPIEGLPSFVEFDLQASTTNPVTQVDVFIKHSVTNLFIVRRRLNVSTQWKTERIPFTPQINAGAASQYQLAVQVVDYSAGVADRFRIGRLRAYQCRQAMNYGHLRTLGGTMAWNGEHLILGDVHYWVSVGDGHLYSKRGIPTTDTDGVIISANPLP